MFTYSNTSLIGGVGGDPELQQSKNGNSYCKFSLATERRFQDKSGEWQSKTTWHNCVAFGKLAESIAKHVRKGSKLHVIGEYTYDENEGKRYYSVLVSTATFIGGVAKGEASSESKTATASAGKAGFGSQPAPVEDDIPF